LEALGPPVLLPPTAPLFVPELFVPVWLEELLAVFAGADDLAGAALAAGFAGPAARALTDMPAGKTPASSAMAASRTYVHLTALHFTLITLS
jgi:hypothetical protein